MDAKALASWKSYEALEETIRRDTPEVAKALHQSLSLVSKWKEQPATDEDFQQSGARNPLDRIETIINTIERIDPERAHVPIKWLCARFGFMPPVRMPEGAHTDTDIIQAILDWNREFGDVCEVISKSLKDKKISPMEYKEIFKEFRETFQAGLTLLQLLEAKVR